MRHFAPCLFMVVIFVATGCGPAGSNAFAELSANMPSITIITTELPNARLGYAYSAQVEALSGGTQSLDAAAPSWSITSGVLPDGVVFGAVDGATATIQGAPTLLGVFPFELRVDDAARGVSDVRAFSITVADVSPVQGQFAGEDVGSRIVFVLDWTGTMVRQASAGTITGWNGQSLPMPAYWQVTVTRLADCLRQLDASVSFAIVLYFSTCWSGVPLINASASMISATPENVEAEIARIASLAIPNGDGSPAYTALRAACLDYGNIDTVVLTADGIPNSDENAPIALTNPRILVTNEADVLAGFQGWYAPHRAAGARLICVSLTTSADSFMTILAGQNDGVVVLRLN